MRSSTSERNNRIQLAKTHLKKGDLITHITDGAGVQEHVFLKWSGDFVIAKPSPTTVLIEPDGCPDGIHASNITYINRTAIEAYEYLNVTTKAKFIKLRPLLLNLVKGFKYNS